MRFYGDCDTSHSEQTMFNKFVKDLEEVLPSKYHLYKMRDMVGIKGKYGLLEVYPHDLPSNPVVKDGKLTFSWVAVDVSSPREMTLELD